MQTGSPNCAIAARMIESGAGDIMIAGGVIAWNKGKTAWQRVVVTGTYEKGGALFHVQQQGRSLRVWSDSGDYGSCTIDANGVIITSTSAGCNAANSIRVARGADQERPSRLWLIKFGKALNSF